MENNIVINRLFLGGAISKIHKYLVQERDLIYKNIPKYMTKISSFFLNNPSSIIMNRPFLPSFSSVIENQNKLSSLNSIAPLFDPQIKEFAKIKKYFVTQHTLNLRILIQFGATTKASLSNPYHI